MLPTLITNKSNKYNHDNGFPFISYLVKTNKKLLLSLCNCRVSQEGTLIENANYVG